MAKDREPEEGAKWQQGGVDYTVNSTDDPRVDDGYYLSLRDEETGEHATAVYNSDNTLADVRANRDWDKKNQEAEAARAREEQRRHDQGRGKGRKRRQNNYPDWL